MARGRHRSLQVLQQHYIKIENTFKGALDERLEKDHEEKKRER